MGITVEEYFARKKACSHCVEHDTEEHCVTTLLSRAENCLIYNIIRSGIGEYTTEERQAARELRNSLSEEDLINYYVRSENIISGIDLLNKFFLDKHDFLTRINYLYVRKMIKELSKSNKENLTEMVENMLDSLEKEYNIPKENKWLQAQS